MTQKYLHFSGGQLVSEEISQNGGAPKSVDVSNGEVSALTGQPFTAADSGDNPVAPVQALTQAQSAALPNATNPIAQGTQPLATGATGNTANTGNTPANTPTEPQLDANGQPANSPTNKLLPDGTPNPNYNPASSQTQANAQAGQVQAPLFSGSNLQQGSKGPQVSQLQSALGITADGNFGPQTLAAVKAFQLSHGLKADGIVGSQTMQALNGPQGSPIQGVASGIQSGQDTTQNGSTGATAPIKTGNATIDALLAQLQNASPQTQFSEVYKQALKDSGVQDMKTEYQQQVKAQSDLANEKNDKIQEINNNPWYSEGVRVGKLKQLDEQYQGKEQILQNQISLLSTNIDNARQDAQFTAGGIMDQANKTASLNESIISKAIDIAETQLEAQQKLQTPDTQVVDAGGRQKLINTKTGAVIADLGASASSLNNSGGGSGGSTDTSDPVVQAYVNEVLSGNATMAQVPAAYRNAVALSMSQPDTSNQYTIKSGDTFKQLADANGTTVQAIQVANPGIDPNKLQVGQKINLFAPTSGNYSPLAGSRYALESTRIAKNYVDLPQYSLTANGLPYLQRIDAALKNPGSVSDQDLLDSLTKLNTAGNAITDAQVKIITDGKSYLDTINTYLNKFQNGGVLSPNQRTQIQKIAQTIYDNYKTGYQPVYDQVTSQLKAAGIPEAFWTIPNLNNLNGSSSSGGSTPNQNDPLGIFQ